MREMGSGIDWRRKSIRQNSKLDTGEMELRHIEKEGWWVVRPVQ